MTALNLVDILIERQLTISALESCTGGLFIASLIAIPNASKVINESIVSYSTESKIKYGVAANIIDTFGVVSPNVALSMAKAAKSTANSSIGVGITGYLSDRPSAEESGLVYVGLAINKTYTFELHYPNLKRTERQHMVVEFVINKLIELLNKA